MLHSECCTDYGVKYVERTRDDEVFLARVLKGIYSLSVHIINCKAVKTTLGDEDKFTKLLRFREVMSTSVYYIYLSHLIHLP